MKKTVSLLIALVMIVALAIPAFAGESTPAEPYAICNHTFGSIKTNIIGREYVNNDYCCDIMQYYQTCTKCGYIRTWEEKGSLILHDTVVLSAYCDGYEQTWREKCLQCLNTGITSKHLCHGRPHSPNVCKWLPV